MTISQKRFTEALAFLALAGIFAIFFLAAAQLDLHPQPAWLVFVYIGGAVGSFLLSVWRFVLFFKS